MGNIFLFLQGAELSQLDLAYAVTVHKAQGGEAKNVILVLAPQHGRLLTRPLLYTGITRARELLVMVASAGSADPIVTAINNLGVESRDSSLVERIVSKGTGMNNRYHDIISFHDEESNSGEIASGNGLRIADEASIAKPDERLRLTLDDLNINRDIKKKLMDREDLQNVEIQSTSTLRKHMDSVSERFGMDGSVPESTILEFVPYLLIASPDYLSKSINFALKIHGKMEIETTLVPGEEESLVMQLARLRDQWLKTQNE